MNKFMGGCHGIAWQFINVFFVLYFRMGKDGSLNPFWGREYENKKLDPS